MNRDELVEQVLGLSEVRPGDKIVEAYDGGDVLAHADIYWRRVMILPPTGRGGPGTFVAGDTILVAAIANVCVLPSLDDALADLYLVDLIESCHREISQRALIDFAVTFADQYAYDRFGYIHPAGHPNPLFLVHSLRGEVWPDGTVDTMGGW